MPEPLSTTEAFEYALVLAADTAGVTRRWVDWDDHVPNAHTDTRGWLRVNRKWLDEQLDAFPEEEHWPILVGIAAHELGHFDDHVNEVTYDREMYADAFSGKVLRELDLSTTPTHHLLRHLGAAEGYPSPDTRVGAVGQLPAGLGTVGSVSLDDLTTDTRDAMVALVNAAAAQGLILTVRSGLRSCAQQREQYQIGRLPGDTRHVVTGVDGCRSFHVLGRAVDFDIAGGTSQDYRTLGAIAEGLGIGWGGRFTAFGPEGDRGHFEYHPGRSISAALALYCPDAADCEAAIARSYADVPPAPEQPPPEYGDEVPEVTAPRPARAWPLLAVLGLGVLGFAWARQT